MKLSQLFGQTLRDAPAEADDHVHFLFLQELFGYLPDFFLIS